MTVYEAILKRRSIRKFRQEEISKEILIKLVDAGRLAPQAANIQPLKYCVINDKDLLKPIFNTCRWAGYIKPDGTPKPGEEPSAYIVILCDTRVQKTNWDVDVGAAGENIILTAVAEGIGSCWIASIDREKIGNILKIPNKYYIHSLIALGYPAESPIVENEQGSIKYYKDKEGILHVPKRKLNDVIFFNLEGEDKE